MPEVNISFELHLSKQIINKIQNKKYYVSNHNLFTLSDIIQLNV